MNGLGFVRFAGSVGIVAGVFGLSAVLAATFIAGNTFSWSKNALSDLGVSSVSLAASVFNYSLLTAGLLNFVFALGFVKAYAKSTIFYFGGLLLILGGGSLSLIGVLTEDYGVLHAYVSVGFFVLVPLGMIVAGLAFRRMNMQTKELVSIFAGVIALLVIVSSIILDWHVSLGLGFAVPEFIESATIVAWTVWLGLGLTRFKP